ncbi:Transmembrane domain-containing protein [Orpheovirus IHUMI-LCC2]|uniref:Transmembrane domain-containing protein n=1 Tax=Orpheovirus IHUMI-LCC2 TaxID=2023057 RepID=A0A2I2L4W2_9VIRU|nr:Transmembrane domain-containing protein [Orpheovirus IHUMI-LCC2]SNW62573.1 Transmembrane domain-containing protein [Orpheovirus IHUMI-LCC2]
MDSSFIIIITIIFIVFLILIFLFIYLLTTSSTPLYTVKGPYGVLPARTVFSPNVVIGQANSVTDAITKCDSNADTCLGFSYDERSNRYIIYTGDEDIIASSTSTNVYIRQVPITSTTTVPLVPLLPTPTTTTTTT